MTDYKYIGDNLNHWAYKEKHYYVVAELDEDTARSFHKFLSNYPQYIKGDLTIRAYDSNGLGTNFILFDNTTGLAIADLTDYENW